MDPTQKAPEDPLVLDLRGTGAAPLRLVGGKALNLGKLVAAGLPVPRGFCLTTAAYELAAPPGLGALAADLDAAGAGAADPAPGTLGTVAGQARRLIEEAPIPPEVDAAVRTSYKELGGTVPVAVRSSATAEDLPFASFAGQQDSYLDVTGADAVVEAVRRCWASLWTERAVAYRSANGISNRDVGLAVVVQTHGRRRDGGRSVHGKPRHREADRNGDQREPGHRARPWSPAPSTRTSSCWRQLPPGSRSIRRAATEPGRTPSLAGPQLRELTALGDGVQRLFGAPQDIEWAIDAGGRIWLTQSRPITTLYPLPEPAPETPQPAPRPRTPGVHVRHPVPGLTRPITPLGLTVLR